MAIAYGTSTSFTEGNGTAVATVSKPASTAIGDVLVAMLYIENAGEAATIASTGDTWTLVPATGPATNTASTPDLHLWVWITVVANASSTIGVTWGGGSFWRDFAVFRFTGVDTTTPQDVPATENVGSTTTVTATGLASGTAGRHLVMLVANFAGDTAATWSSPLTERNDSGNVAMASGEDTAGTDTGNKTVTITPATDWAAVMLALRPASAGETITVDKWQRPASEPKRPLRRVREGLLAFDHTGRVEVEHPDAYILRPEIPARRATAQQGGSVYPPYQEEVAEEIMLDKWYRAPAEPRRLVRRAQGISAYPPHQEEVAAPEDIRGFGGGQAAIVTRYRVVGY